MGCGGSKAAENKPDEAKKEEEEILIHQPLISGGLSGQTTEIKIHADQMVKTREKLNKLLSEKTGQSLEQIEKDTERDHYMTAQEALEYGLIDEIIDVRK